MKRPRRVRDRLVRGRDRRINHPPPWWRAGVCFYQRESLPGYSAIFRHPNDELNYCYYLIPCGKDGMCGDVTARPALKSSPTPNLLQFPSSS